jgi:hypothetical protein
MWFPLKEAGAQSQCGCIKACKIAWWFSLKQGVLELAQGREQEWLFAAEEGQWAVAADCMARRVVLVTLGRGHSFAGVAAVNKELSPLVRLRSSQTGQEKMSLFQRPSFRLKEGGMILG